MCKSLFIIFGLLFPVLLAAQMSRDNANRVVDLRVTLGFEDGGSLRNQQMGQNSASDAGRDVDSGSADRSRETSSNFQIRVQLQDSFGVTLEEASPSSEGTVVFKVRNGSEFRLRVFGPEIEEVFVERIEPAFGGSMVAVSLRRRGQASPSTKIAKTPIAAVRLNIPAKAQKELDKGSQALANSSLDDARRSFEKAIEIYPNYDLAFNNLGVTLMQQGDIEGGRKAFEKAIELNGTFARAYINLAKLELAQKKYANAQVFLAKALIGEPLNAQAVFLSAQAHFFSEEIDAVITDVKKLHNLPHAQYGLAHYLAGKSYAAKGLSSEAVQELEMFVAEDPRDPNIPAAKKLLTHLRSPKLQAK